MPEGDPLREAIRVHRFDRDESGGFCICGEWRADLEPDTPTWAEHLTEIVRPIHDTKLDKIRALCETAMTADRLWTEHKDGVQVAHAVVTVRELRDITEDR